MGLAIVVHPEGIGPPYRSALLGISDLRCLLRSYLRRYYRQHEWPERLQCMAVVSIRCFCRVYYAYICALLSTSGDDLIYFATKALPYRGCYHCRGRVHRLLGPAQFPPHHLLAQ